MSKSKLVTMKARCEDKVVTLYFGIRGNYKRCLMVAAKIPTQGDHAIAEQRFKETFCLDGE